MGRSRYKYEIDIDIITVGDNPQYSTPMPGSRGVRGALALDMDRRQHLGFASRMKYRLELV